MTELKLICKCCGANQFDYIGISVDPKGVRCSKCGEYDQFKI